MRRHWLDRRGTQVLTLVFGGWGLGTAPFAGLVSDNDVLIVDDFRTLDDDLPEVRAYDRFDLLAYSFGVASAAHWQARTGLKANRSAAVNGTVYPADTGRGIPPQTVAGTLQGLTADSFAKFCRRAGFKGAIPDIDIAVARAELEAIVERGAGPEMLLDRIWISTKDRIVPPKAQETAWQAQASAIRRIVAGHQPFAAGQNWKEWFV